jgi:hypothetical protein
MAGVVAIVSTIASLVTLASQITKLSYGYPSDVRDANQTCGQYLTELSAFTDVLLHAQQIASEAERLCVSPPAALSTDVFNDCHKQLVLLRRNLETHAADSRGLTPIKSTLLWPLEEQQMKKHIKLLHRFRSVLADYVSASTL